MIPVRRRGQIRVGALLGSLTVLATGCGGGGEAPSDATEPAGEVTIKTFMYDPDPLEIEAGTEVTWTNEDRILHTVTSGTREQPTKEFDEELNDAGTSASVPFDSPGTYDYFCSVHDGMDGQVIVK